MSRIGRMPIALPAGVTVDIAENNKVTVKGPKGTLERVLPAEMEIKLDGTTVTVSRPNDLKKMKSLHGLTRTLINNMVVGVSQGFEELNWDYPTKIYRDDIFYIFKINDRNHCRIIVKPTVDESVVHYLISHTFEVYGVK